MTEAKHRCAWLIVTVTASVVWAGGARADSLVDAARAAVQGERWCEARDLYIALHERDGESKYLYNAAESAAAADDRVAALDLYRKLLVKDPTFDRAAKANERVAELGGLIAASGSGKTCPAAAPMCGDNRLDRTEMCDDGNAVSGDGCDDNCTPTSCGNGIVTAPETCDDGNTVDDATCPATCGDPANAVHPTPAAPPPSSSSSPPPLAPIIVTGAGGVVLIGGLVVAAFGGVGWLELEDRRTALQGATAAVQENPDDVLRQQANVDARVEADLALASWNDVGQVLWVAGVAGAAVGAATVAAGAAWLAMAE